MSWYPSSLMPFRCDDEGVATRTSEAQVSTEDECAAWYAEVGELTSLVLARDKHIAYLLRSLDGLSASFTSLDASRTWIVYWILHSLDLLDVRPVDRFPSIIDFLGRCQCASGGFGGGPQQGPHTASTFAAILSLLIIGSEEAYASIDRRSLLAFYRSVKHPVHGGFRVQTDGEMDVRGAYTVLAVAHLLNLTGADPTLLDGAADFLLGCQSHEGGFGGEPGNEAHGGYTYCAVAGLHIAGAFDRCDVPALTRWLCGRQMPLEGGFQGRTNKLVDSCYSFWQGAVFALLPPVKHLRRRLPSSDAVGSADQAGLLVDDDMLLDRRRLQSYILACCQSPEGGLRDKPGKSRDLYHTCYALSGLSIAQHGRAGSADNEGGFVLGGSGNAVAATHPLFNMRLERVRAAEQYFKAQPL